VIRIADGQLGLITRTQLFGLGLSRALVDKSLRLGRVVGIHRGVYAVASLSSLPPLAPYLAAVLAVGDAYLVDRHLAVARFTRDQVVKETAVVLVRLTKRLTLLLAAQSGRSRRIVR